jgi:hypothetical protein
VPKIPDRILRIAVFALPLLLGGTLGAFAAGSAGNTKTAPQSVSTAASSSGQAGADSHGSAPAKPKYMTSRDVCARHRNLPQCS